MDEVGKVGDAVAFKDGRIDGKEDGEDLGDHALVGWVCLGQAKTLKDGTSGVDGGKTADTKFDQEVGDILFGLDLELRKCLTNSVCGSIGPYFVCNGIEELLTLRGVENWRVRQGVGEERLEEECMLIEADDWFGIVP